MLLNSKFKSFTIGLLLLVSCAFAQTGIGTSTPHASAKLHVSATDKGFLPPRVNLTAATDATTIPSPAEGLLVYNLGSVGLQAGYYFWNGANWATIATGTTAGNAVIASNLVKLYQEAYSTTSGKASSVSGYSFSVPVSGRYEFNFNCTGWNSPSGSKVLLTFNIRQSTTVLGSDYHESSSSNAYVEYEGRFEVNLTAGVTYNAQVVTTTGQRNTNDWDKIFYKQVAGNLPVNQHMAVQNIQLNNNFLSNDGDNEGIRIDNSGNVGIGTASPNASALLDLTSTNKGLLAPRVTLTSKSGNTTPIASPTTGLIVYNSATSGSNSDAVRPGYYYFNGSVWTRMDPEVWSTGVPITFGATTTAPTKGTTSFDYVRYRNLGGKEYEVEYNYVQTGAGNAGNGDYLITLPEGLQFDYTALGQTANTGAGGYNAIINKILSSNGDLFYNGGHNSATVIPYDATRFRIHTNNWGTVGWTFFNSSYYQLNSNTSGFKMAFKFKAL